ncbi:MAG: hypothetical protein RMJ89_03585 [Flammeovirgaceae bacterium]|nr:hypothetical protein [Flammeovirgaceae bacterium]
MKKINNAEVIRFVGFVIVLKIIAIVMVLLITEYGVHTEENEKFVLSKEKQVNT